MYQWILDASMAGGAFTLTGRALDVTRNVVSLENAYGSLIALDSTSIDYRRALDLILGYLGTATGLDLVSRQRATAASSPSAGSPRSGGPA